MEILSVINEAIKHPETLELANLEAAIKKDVPGYWSHPGCSRELMSKRLFLFLSYVRI
jgi:hypothetical protein